MVRKARHLIVVTSVVAAHIACVGDSPDAGGGEQDAGIDATAAASSGSPPPITGSASSGGSSSSSSSSSGTPVADASTDVAAPPDSRCTGPVQIQGAGDATVACGLFASAGPTVPLALGAYDLVNVSGGLGTGVCAEELWRASVEVLPDGDNFAMHLSAEVAGVTASYEFTATVGPNSTLLVQSLCDSALPFDEPDPGPHAVDFKIEQSTGEPRQLTFRMRSSAEPNRFRDVRLRQR